MKTLLFVIFFALIALSFARPQTSYETNGPAKLYKIDSPGKIHLRTNHIAANVERVSSAVLRHQVSGKGVARISRNGPHRIVDVKTK